MPAPTESGRGRPAEMSPRHPHSPASTREVRMLTALEDKAATKHAPRSPDRDVGSDDDESMYSVDSHGARIGPYTPERGAPPSYEHVMLSPMPTEPPSTPPRLGHHCSYSGEGGAEYDSLGFPIPDWLSPRYEEIRITFPAARAKQLTALEAYRAAAPESRAPGGEARLRLALEGVHTLHRGDVWCEALDAKGKRDACSLSYDAYLDRGACDEAMASMRDAIRRDAESAFACHPRFARVVERRAFPYRRDIFASSGSFKQGDGLGDVWDDEDDGSVRSSGSAASSRGRSDMSGASTSSRASTTKLTAYCLLDALERVCAAHAARSPHGHSSMACTVAGVLLLVTEDEEKSFWMLTCFAEDLVPWFFLPCHTGLLTECLAFDEAVRRKLPLFARTCASACVRPSLLCAGWLAKLGANALPGESVSRLWDALILEGGDVLPHAAVAFLKVEGDAVLLEARREGGNDAGSSVSGAALLDAAERRAAAHFETDDVVADAVFQARAARECVEWARARADVTRRVATRRASVASFARLRELFFEETRVSADAFAFLVAASYVDESREDAAAAADAFEAACNEKSPGATFAAWLDACRISESESLRACVSLTDPSVWKTSTNENDALRAFLRGDEESAEAGNTSPETKSPTFDAPSPVRLASATRAARGAFARGDDAGRTFVCASDASAAALESAMLFGRGGERWLESVRGDARGAVALAAVASAVAAASPARDGKAFSSRRASFSVSLATTEDIVLSMGHLFAWPPRTPHTQYAALVLVKGRAPRRVVKRYSDFRALHEAAEREGVAAAVGPALALPFAAPGTISWSSDPAVVQQRRVQLQRYLDVLKASGCPAAGGLLRAFLNVDEEEADGGNDAGGVSVFGGEGANSQAFCPRTLRRRSSLEKRRKVRGVCALGAMTCGPSAFTGELAPIAAW